MEPDGVLFPKGGFELSHIAISKQDQEPRSEKATIFSQGLIVTRKLNKLWLHVFFDEQYDEGKEVKSDEAKMKPIYMGNHDGDDPEVIPIVRNQALMDAALSGVDDMTFDVSDPTPWWPYAIFTAVTKAGWGRDEDQDVVGADLVKQTLELLTGYPAISYSTKDPNGGGPKDLQVLKWADESPFIIQIKPFDQGNAALRGLRWEKWVSVMSFDASTSQISFATSFYDGDDGVTQTVSINDIEIEWVVQLQDERKLEVALGT